MPVLSFAAWLLEILVSVDPMHKWGVGGCIQQFSMTLPVVVSATTRRPDPIRFIYFVALLTS